MLTTPTDNSVNKPKKTSMHAGFLFKIVDFKYHPSAWRYEQGVFAGYARQSLNQLRPR